MQNELQLQAHNDINELNFHGFNAMAYDMFLGTCIEMKGKGTDEVTLSFSDIKQRIDYKNKNDKQFEEDLIESADKMIRLHSRITADGETMGYNFFQRYRVVPDEEKIYIRVTDVASYLINQFVKNYISTDWKEYKLMDTSYSRRLYLLLKQYRTAQKWYNYKYGGVLLRIDDFRNKMAIPDSYKMSDIDKQIFKPSLRDFERAGCFENIKIVKHKKGKGNAITHIEIKFKPEPHDYCEVPQVEDKKTRPEKIENIENQKAENGGEYKSVSQQATHEDMIKEEKIVEEHKKKKSLFSRFFGSKS